MSVNLQSELLDFVQVAGTLMEKSAEQHATIVAQKKACAKLIPDVVQALLENERIEPHQKEAAERVLQDPIKVLEILAKTAAHRNPTEQAIGKPVAPTGQVKKAGSNNMGRKVQSDTDAPTLALKLGLGLI